MKILYMVSALILLFVHGAHAASFDCAEAASDLEKTICSDEQLSQLDGYMSEYYFKLMDSLDKTSARKLLTEQRSWLKAREKKCGNLDTACLVNYYQARVTLLRTKYENLVPFTPSDAAAFQGIRNICGFEGIHFPEDLKVLAGGGYSGSKTNYQIDDSGHQANRFDVIVNSPGQPVALILGAYEPSLWNIAWTQGTYVKAVVVTGYHRQIVAGLPNSIPILNSTHENQGPCGYIYVEEKNLHKINPFSNRIFGKDVSMVYYAGKGKLVFGKQVTPKARLYTSKDNPPEAFIDKSKPLAGQAGLRDLASKGLLRKSTSKDVERWAKKKAEMNKDKLPPVATGKSWETYKPKHVHNGYVILDKITIPAGLYGGNLATFFLEEGVPYPNGKLGHSTLYDFNDMSCHGPSCGH